MLRSPSPSTSAGGSLHQHHGTQLEDRRGLAGPPERIGDRGEVGIDVGPVTAQTTAAGSGDANDAWGHAGRAAIGYPIAACTVNERSVDENDLGFDLFGGLGHDRGLSRRQPGDWDPER